MENNTNQIIETNNAELVVRKQSKGDVIRSLLSSQETNLLPLLDGNKSQYHKLAAAFCFTLIEKQLENCSPISIIKAFKKCCELNLDPSSGAGKIYLIKYGNEVNAQIGYQGYLDLIMRRTDIISNVDGHIVYQGDEFNIEYGNVTKFTHIPKFESKQLSLTYAVVRFKDGSIQIEIADKDDIELSRSLSKSGEYKSSPWQVHYNSMAKVVPMRKLVKNLALSITTEDEFIRPEEVKSVPSKQAKRVPLKLVKKNYEDNKQINESYKECAEDIMAYAGDPDFYKM